MASAASTRERILDAAATVLREHGFARATTKQIAAEAGCSEALLYKHFRAKEDLFIAILKERTPGHLTDLLTSLRDEPGRDTVEANLVEAAEQAIHFYRESFPVAVSIFSEQRLFANHRAALIERGAGPHVVNAWLTDYLRAEQELGRVRQDADPRAVASLLLGAALQHAFFGQFAPQPDPRQHAEALVRALLPGLTS